MPWGGVGACLLAWCGSLRETKLRHWALRIGCGIGGAALAHWLFGRFPQVFLPMYETYRERYQDLDANPNLRRLVNDNGAAILHMGLYLGLLTYEMIRRDVKNVVLILTVGIVSGAGWSMLQNWTWAPDVFGDARFNWWRCWETTGGISIGVGYGLAYFLVNRRMSDAERRRIRANRAISGPNGRWAALFVVLTALAGVLILAQRTGYGAAYLIIVLATGLLYWWIHRVGERRESQARLQFGDPNIERWGMYLALLIGLGSSIRNGLEGCIRIYGGDQDYWSAQLWRTLGPVYLFLLIALCLWIFWRPLPASYQGDLFPHAAALAWTTLIVQNLLGQAVTGPATDWNQFVFKVYYLLLFLITAVIVIHYSGRARSSAVA
jgi:hypothetical protein